MFATFRDNAIFLVTMALVGRRGMLLGLGTTGMGAMNLATFLLCWLGLCAYRGRVATERPNE